jgi:hypothetical protein
VGVEFFTGFEHGGGPSIAASYIGDGADSNGFEIGLGSAHAHGKYYGGVDAAASSTAWYKLARPGSNGQHTETFSSDEYYISLWFSRFGLQPNWEPLLTFESALHNLSIVYGRIGGLPFHFGLIDTYGNVVGSTNSFSSTDFYHLQLYVKHHPTNWRYNYAELWVNGVSEVTMTSFRLHGAGNTWDPFLYVGKRADWNGIRTRYSYDDIVVSNSGFLPTPHYIAWMTPNEDGAYLHWRPPSYEKVDARPWNTTDGVSDPIESGLFCVGLEDRAAIGESSGVYGKIHAIRPTLAGVVSRDGFSTMRMLTRSASTDFFLDEFAVPEMYTGCSSLYLSDPALGVPWGVHGMDLLQVGMQATKMEEYNTASVRQIGAQILFGDHSSDTPTIAWTLGG